EQLAQPSVELVLFLPRAVEVLELPEQLGRLLPLALLKESVCLLGGPVLGVTLLVELESEIGPETGNQQHEAPDEPAAFFSPRRRRGRLGGDRPRRDQLVGGWRRRGSSAADRRRLPGPRAHLTGRILRGFLNPEILHGLFRHRPEEGFLRRCFTGWFRA